MIDVLSVDNMRKSDAATVKAGTPGRTLMMRAARAVFENVAWYGRIGIICGSGNNAGDGYALALCLDEAGYDVSVIRVYDRFSGDGRYYYDECAKSGISIYGWDASGDLNGYTILVDALLGTGFKGELRPELDSVISAINASKAYVVSIDINSGLNGDTGMARKCVLSDLTVSVGDYKSGHFLNMAKDVMKEKINCDIGITPVDAPCHLIEAGDVSRALGKRLNHSNKGTYGYAALIGGCTRYSGAIRLAYLADAAMRGGAGVVKVALPVSIVPYVASHILESTLFPLHDAVSGDAADADDELNAQIAYIPKEIDELTANVRTVVFGMGVGTQEGARAVLGHLLRKYDKTLAVDADGLTLLASFDREKIKESRCRIILTPHIREFSRLTGLTIDEINDDPIAHAKEYASSTGTVVLLKGPSTIITDGDRVYITDRGCPGMATAGSGDVLSGIMAATLSYVGDTCMAAAAAAYINGAAGEAASARYGDISMTAGDTVAAISDVIRSLDV